MAIVAGLGITLIQVPSIAHKLIQAEVERISQTGCLSYQLAYPRDTHHLLKNR